MPTTYLTMFVITVSFSGVRLLKECQNHEGSFSAISDRLNIS